MVSVVLLSLILICAVPASLAETVTRAPEIAVVATPVLEELALRVPETLASVIAEEAPEARFSALGLALIAAGVPAAVTVTAMATLPRASRTVKRAVPAALAATLIFLSDRLALATFALEVLTFTLPETLARLTLAEPPTVSANVVGVA